MATYDSIEIPASNSRGNRTKERERGRLEILHGRDRWMSGISRLTGRFFLNRKRDDFTLAYPPPSINPANCSPYKFFSFLPRARTYNAHDPPLPFTCPTHFQETCSSPLHARTSRRGRDSKLRICFSTSLFTFSRRRARDE